MSKTTKDLEEAFAGESQANRKYSYFAQKADEEGHKQVAKLFRAAAVAEAVHAKNHLKALDGIGGTADNLKAAIAGENHEVTSMYPDFIKDAETESVARALRTFRWAFEVEKIHEQLYRQALAALEAQENLGDADYYVCPFCGYTHEGPLDGKCPVCGTPGEKFERIS